MPIDQSDWPDITASDQTYRAFLIRCWQEEVSEPGEEPRWRFTLVHFNGERARRGFACLEDLCSYLGDELAKASAKVGNGEMGEGD